MYKLFSTVILVKVFLFFTIVWFTQRATLIRYKEWPTGLTENNERTNVHVGRMNAVPFDLKSVSDFETNPVALGSTTDDRLSQANGGCDHITGLRIDIDKFDQQSTAMNTFDCNEFCGGSASSRYRLVNYTKDSDIFVNGVRPIAKGLYCVRSDADVVHCNTATSRLVSGPQGKWACVPRWPHFFGGPDGADIMVCGGSIRDETTRLVYADRLPPSRQLPKLSNDPYVDTTVIKNKDGKVATVLRWKCPPGSYLQDQTDSMSNEYMPMPSNRMKKMKNWCAQYIYRAIAQIAPSKGSEGYCDCLPAHGKIKVYGEKVNTSENAHATAEIDEGIKPRNGMISVPHACCPCPSGGGLDNDSYVVNIARPCLKSYERSVLSDIDITPEKLLHYFPCGVNGFDRRSASCMSATVYVGFGLSEFGRKLVGRKTLWKDS